MNNFYVERRKDTELTPADSFTTKIDDLFNSFSDKVIQGSDNPFQTARTGEEELLLQGSAVIDIDDSISVNIRPNLKSISLICPIAGAENIHPIGGHRLLFEEKVEGKYSSVTYRVDGDDVMKRRKKPMNRAWTREEGERYERNMQARVKLSEEIIALNAVGRAAAPRIVKGEVVQQGELSDILDIIAKAVPEN